MGLANKVVFSTIYQCLREGVVVTLTSTTTEPTPTTEPTTGTVIVKKVVNCLAEDPNCAVPSDFTIVQITQLNGKLKSFAGSGTGTTVTLEPGLYTITEEDITNLVVNGHHFCATEAGDCRGTIAAEQKSCTLTNTDRNITYQSSYFLI